MMKLVFVSIFATFLANTFVRAVHHGRPVYDISKVPYVVSIYYNNQYICGGSIISNYWILTAAHCVAQIIIILPSNEEVTVDKNVDSLGVRTGTSKFNDHGVRFQVEKIIRCRPGNNYQSDIALIKLKIPISFNENQKSIPIACSEQGRPRVDDNVTLSGFGINENKKNPDYLQQMDATVIHVNEESFDTVDLNRVYHADAGDSGSPVVYQDILVGIAQQTYPGPNGADHHTIIDIYTPWIKTVTQLQVQEKCPLWT